jgi:hypothetical protein
MTELLTRPPAAQATHAADAVTADASVWWRGALAALWAVSLGGAVLVVAALLVWASDARSGAGAGGAIRSALQLWLLAHKVPMHVRGGAVAVAPLGLSLVLGVVIARAAAVLGRGHGVDDAGGVGVVALAVGVPYGVLTAFVAAAATSTAVRPSPIAALGAGMVFGCGAAAWGAARGTGRMREIGGALPRALREPAIAAGRALTVLLATSVVLVLIAVARNIGAAADSAHQLGGGLVAGLALFLLDAMLVPNAVLAALGYLSGPGFALGTHTSVSQTSVHLGALPSLPVLAGVPRAAASPMVSLCCVAMLLAAGAAAGWRIGRVDDTSWSTALGWTVAAAAATGAAAALLVALAGGPAGPGRMAAVGASPWQVGLAIAGEVLVGALLVVLPQRLAARR